MPVGGIRALDLLLALTQRDSNQVNDDRLMDGSSIENNQFVDMQDLINRLDLERLIERYATQTFVPIPDRILKLNLDV